jgi:alpha-L-rhamnosidase
MRRFPSLVGSICAGVVLAGLACQVQAATGKASVTRNNAEVVLENDALRLVIDTAAGHPKATRLLNKLSNRAVSLASDDFALHLEGRQPLRSADFSLRRIDEETLPDGRRLVFHLAAREPAVTVDMIYELRDADFFLRRWLRITPAKDRPLALREIEAWRVGVAGAAAYQGYGVPIFLEDTFWGLEFPGGRNAYADGAVSLIHHPGRSITGPYTTKTAVLGMAEPGRVRARFLQYVKTFQATPKDLRLFVNYNTWWTLMPPDEKNCLELIDLFRQKLFLPYGESIDTFTIDDGWDNKDSLWEIRKDRFPNGFAPVVERLKTIRANLGLWLSPSSGYSHAPWGAAHGYARNSNEFFLCQSWPKYRRDIAQVVTGLAKQYDMAFFKFDGFGAACKASGHGHLPGDFAKEANIEAFLELMAAVRQARPGCYIDPTCGMWLSPWWLREADSIWGPVSGDLASAVVPSPVLRYSSTTTRDGVFRLRCRDYQGFPPTAVEHLGIIVITPEPWEDDAMAVLGRGCRLLTLYINPKCFEKGDRDWAFLASILKWARHNGTTLHHDTQMVLGDPMRRQPYGHAHFCGQRGIVALRNPVIERQDVEVKLDETAGWKRDEALAGGDDAQFLARIVYPRHEVLPQIVRYGDVLKVLLSAYETLILHLEPLPRNVMVVAGARCRPGPSAGNRAEYEVFGLPGEKLQVAVFGPAPVRAEFDGRPVELAAQLTLPAGETAGPAADGGQFVVQPSAQGFKAAGRCTVHVPPSAAATVHVLCEFRGKEEKPLTCQATVNGRPAKVEIIRKKLEQDGDDSEPGRSWAWLKFGVPAGQSQIELTIDNYQADGKPLAGQIGWWLWTERPTEPHKLVLELDGDVPPPAVDPLPLPVEMERFRQVVPIQRLATPAVAPGQAADLTVARLRCAYRANPLGVEAAHPRLSWGLQSAQRGQRQTAYQVLVASSAESLAKDQGDLWDSGKVVSDQSIHVPYAGKPLASRMQCYWKLRAWDKNDRPSSWSEPARWTMGLLKPTDWQARWIAASAPLPLLRREFRVAKPVRRADLYVCGLGFYELHLNGQKVGDSVLDPGWTNYRKTCLYAAYDVTRQLVEGDNALGVMLGNGMYNVAGGRYTKFTGSFGPPKLVLQLHIEYADGSSSIVVSDGSWKTAAGPTTFSCIYGGEDYDARKEPAGWDRPGFDERSWTPARVVEGPGGRLVAQSAPPIKVMQEFKTVKVTQPQPGVFVYDLGRNFSGWPRLTVQGPIGAVVKMTPGELLDDAGMVTQRSSGGPTWFSYTLQGGDKEVWHPRFSYYGFRYVQVEGAAPAEDNAPPDRPRVLDLTGQFVHSSAETVGHFSCSDPKINQIHDLIDAAILSNLQSVLTDCPHREKLGWLEVSHLLAGGIIFNYDVPTLCAKICNDMQEAQLPGGLVPDIAPEYTVFRGGFRDSPEWGSAYVIDPWQVYQWYGDSSLLTMHYAGMKKYVAYLGGKSKGHIVSHGLGDWYDIGPRPPGESQLTSKGLTSTAVYYQDLTVLQQTAKLLNKPEEAERFAQQAAHVRAAFNRAFFHPDGRYDRDSQTANAMPLTLGIVEADHRAAVLENLVRSIRAGGNHVTAGDVGFSYLVRALSDGGRGDVLHDVVCNPNGPGYVYQLAKGATSLTEAWDTNPASSQNHCMLGHAEEWFYRGLAGIAPDPAGPGFKRLFLKPQIVGDLAWVAARYESPYGDVQCTWKPEANRLVVDVSVPPNATATVYIPTRNVESVMEGDQPAARAEGCRLLRHDAQTAVFEVGSGRYRFLTD